MKKLLFTLSALVILLIGCDKIDELTQFNLEYNQSLVIPSSTGVTLPFNIFTPDIESNSESTFSSNNTNKDLIEEITLTKMQLTLSSPKNGNFGFLKSIEIFISAEGIPEQRIAWKENIANDIDKNLQLETTDRDLKEFIKKEKYKLRLNTVTDEVITSDHHIEVNSVFFVDAKILGI